jgi:AcrR family transcriptional regulator
MTDQGKDYLTTRRDLQKKETKEVIRKAARALFQTHGFEKATIREIASTAGVGIGTVHLHFRDKESLLVECLIDDMEDANRESWQSMPKGVPVREKILHLAREGYRGWTRKPSLSRAILGQMIMSKRPELDRLRALDRSVIGWTTELLRDAQERGEIRPDVDPALATKAIFSFYLTSSLDWLGSAPRDEVAPATDGAPALTEAALDALVDEAGRFLDQLFQGIGPEKGAGG